MSKENRPNVNAVGLVADAYQSLETYMRGKAAEDKAKAFALCAPLISKFANDVSDTLDEHFGR